MAREISMLVVGGGGGGSTFLGKCWYHGGRSSDMAVCGGGDGGGGAICPLPTMGWCKYPSTKLTQKEQHDNFWNKCCNQSKMEELVYNPQLVENNYFLPSDNVNFYFVFTLSNPTMFTSLPWSLIFDFKLSLQCVKPSVINFL